jgi:hypothetical protein
MRETNDEKGDCLILGKVHFHRQMTTDKSKVKGGGWWSLDDNTFTFYGESDEFGKASFDDIRSCVENNKVFSSPSLIKSITKLFNFRYKDEMSEYYNL